MTIKKVSLLLLTGFALGLFFAVRGWSDAPAAGAKMISYSHPQGLYHFRYPAGWTVSENNTATLVKSPGDPGLIGVFGIVRIKDEQTLHDAILNDVKARSGGVSQSDATVAGLHAVKLVGPKKDDPNTKMVEYYVELPTGKKFYILLMGPQNDWSRYNAAFYNMMRTLNFG